MAPKSLNINTPNYNYRDDYRRVGGTTLAPNDDDRNVYNLLLNDQQAQKNAARKNNVKVGINSSLG